MNLALRRVPLAWKCDDCGKLLSLYDEAVTRYTAACRRLCGMVADDFKMAYSECEKLRRACVSAERALHEHLGVRHAHGAEGGGARRLVACSNEYASPIRRGSLHAIPVKPTP
jgi:hypothetical protein